MFRPFWFARFLKFFERLVVQQPGYRKASLACRIRTHRTCVTARFSTWRSSGNQLGAACVVERKRADCAEDWMRKLLCCVLVSALARGAAELAGKWSGSFDITTPNGETKADTAYMDLKEKSGEVTGTAGPGVEKQWSLRKGKLDGQQLTFEVPTDDGGLLVFDLTFDGTAIQGTCAGTGNGGEKMSAKANLKRTT